MKTKMRLVLQMEKQAKTTYLLEDRYYSLMRVRFKDL